MQDARQIGLGVIASSDVLSFQDEMREMSSEREVARTTGEASPTRPHRLPLNTPDISHTHKPPPDLKSVGTESFL